MLIPRRIRVDATSFDATLTQRYASAGKDLLDHTHIMFIWKWTAYKPVIYVGFFYVRIIQHFDKPLIA